MYLLKILKLNSIHMGEASIYPEIESMTLDAVAIRRSEAFPTKSGIIVK